ncbi:MAG: diaminopimelate decarboxylase [Bacteroidales bacterium]|nr:diaminopimelate decarboxylase [Candidatus Cacconaster scatequi]
MVTFKDIKKIGRIRTPFYYYDMELLESTLNLFRELLDEYGYTGHFALKSNDRKRILETVRKYGLGADCVSGDEVSLALNCGFPSDSIVFAGVGKSDREIVTALKSGIFCFNCESIPELEVIDSLASKLRVTANVALRINPEVDAHTLSNISTGRKEDKFGISLASIDKAIDKVKYAKNLKLIGLHFHIGSQIEDMEVFATLCRRINEIQVRLSGRGITVSDINVGGGLGVDYRNPDSNPIPPFREYFETIHRNLILLPGQKLHLEPGRSIVAQCGSLISRVLYLKEGSNRNFLVLDAGMNDLVRPALYGSYHKIENLTSKENCERYDVVGPVCESSDCWGKGRILPRSSRGDLMAIRSAGAYGQVMAMRYNARPLAKEYYSDQF